MTNEVTDGGMETKESEADVVSPLIKLADLLFETALGQGFDVVQVTTQTQDNGPYNVFEEVTLRVAVKKSRYFRSVT